MSDLLHSDHFTIQSKLSFIPRLTTRFNIVDDNNNSIGTLVFHPAWSFPLLWIVGFLFEIALISGGIYLAVKQEGNLRLAGIGIACFGVLALLLFRFHSFLATRSPSTTEIRDRGNTLLLSARKGWAFAQPLLSIYDAQNKLLGTSRQSLFWGDRKILLWDAQGNKWGQIKRKLLGFQYRIFRGSKEVARFRRKLVDARKLLGLRSFVLEFSEPSLTTQERSLILATLGNSDVLIRQKKLRKETPQPQPVPKA